MNDPKLKQQIADRIKDASNILVTVSNNPSVDELSAALGLTILLNKMDKHATAIFSGKTPPAITFLDPEKTFENTTDSLRDFIIALDKEKADHLRYKLEGDLVKIYITPYRNTISSDDLDFSQGDYNVELVIALGVENKDHLDEALEGHGKILHDATVVTLTAGEQVSNLGSIDWHDSNASSLSEMLGTLHEAMKVDRKLLDKTIATAWLTGIVAATERFSNPRTTSRVMTLAANLMAAGADQQLIAARLEEATEAETTSQEKKNSNGAKLTEGKSTKLPQPKEKKEAKTTRPNGELVISHEKQGTIEEVADEIGAERLAESARAAERALEKHSEMTAADASKSPEKAPEPTTDTTPTPETSTPAQPVPQPPIPNGPVAYTPSTTTNPEQTGEPTFGGTLNATSEQAEEDKRRELEKEKNKVILSHNYIGDQEPNFDAAINSAVDDRNKVPSIDPFGGNAAPSSIEPPSTPTLVAQDIAPPSQTPPAQSAQTLADLDASNRTPSDDARAAVDAALAAPTPAPVTPAPVQPPLPEVPTIDNGLPLPPPPPLPSDFSDGMPPLPPLPSPLPPAEPERLGDILAPEQPAPTPAPEPNPQPAAPAGPNDPGQFRIPGA